MLFKLSPDSETLVPILTIPTSQLNETHNWDNFQKWDCRTLWILTSLAALNGEPEVGKARSWVLESAKKQGQAEKQRRETQVIPVLDQRQPCSESLSRALV